MARVRPWVRCITQTQRHTCTQTLNSSKNARGKDLRHNSVQWPCGKTDRVPPKPTPHVGNEPCAVSGQAKSLYRGVWGTDDSFSKACLLQIFTEYLLCAIQVLGIQRCPEQSPTWLAGHRRPQMSRALSLSWFSKACPVMRQVCHQRAPEEFQTELTWVLDGNVIFKSALCFPSHLTPQVCLTCHL